MFVPFPFISPQPHKKCQPKGYYRIAPTQKSQTNKFRSTTHLGTSLHIQTHHYTFRHITTHLGTSLHI